MALDVTQLELLKLFSIPIVAGLVGWGTNWLAIKLMFYPLEFIGFYPLRLGWQGVIPSKAEKMAKIVVEKGLQSLANMQEVYQQLDHDRLNEQFVKVMDRRLEAFVDEVMLDAHPVFWENLPWAMKKRFYSKVREQLPHMVAEIMDQISVRIEEFLDLEDMVSTQLVNNKTLLNQIFLEAGSEEFKFIVRSGFWFGLMFGVVQAGVWFVYPQWWILPLFGLLVGYLTNDIALRIIFQPLNPIHFGPISVQGLFLKRQKEVARVLCRITTQEILTINHMLYAMLTGPKADDVVKMIQHKTRHVVERKAGLESAISKRLTLAALGRDKYSELTQKAESVALRYARDELQENDAFHKGQGEIIENLLRERMESLSSEEFQGVLRPAFKEDEWALIAVGAVLGMLAGIAQLVFVFGRSISF